MTMKKTPKKPKYNLNDPTKDSKDYKKVLMIRWIKIISGIVLIALLLAGLINYKVIPNPFIFLFTPTPTNTVTPTAPPTPIPLPSPLTETVHFEFDQSTLTDQQKELIISFHDNLNSQKGTISINGYADEIGTEEYNQELSEKRARYVADLLIQQGVSESDILPSRKWHPKSGRR